jgi:hypothetical protein
LELSKKLSTGDLKSKLAQSSEELSKNYARSLKEIEVEWDNMYQKFSGLAGRMDRKRGLENLSKPETVEKDERQISRSDLLRGRK